MQVCVCVFLPAKCRERERWREEEKENQSNHSQPPHTEHRAVKVLDLEGVCAA